MEMKDCNGIPVLLKIIDEVLWNLSNETGEVLLKHINVAINLARSLQIMFILPALKDQLSWETTWFSGHFMQVLLYHVAWTNNLNMGLFQFYHVFSLRMFQFVFTRKNDIIVGFVQSITPLEPEQYSCLFADNISKCIILKEKFCILIQIYLKGLLRD